MIDEPAGRLFKQFIEGQRGSRLVGPDEGMNSSRSCIASGVQNSCLIRKLQAGGVLLPVWLRT